jgi:hypothetical protein
MSSLPDVLGRVTGRLGIGTIDVEGPIGSRRAGRWIVAAAVAVVATTLLVPSVNKVTADSSASASSLAGTGGVPGGREAGRWIDAHVPRGATFMTIGPSMANIIEFYGHRQALGLAVSPNPLNRNPSYKPLPNPDRSIRNADVQYLAWDAYSATRSHFFAASITRFADRYSGRVVHTEYVTSHEGGRQVKKPVIVIYQVRP